MKSHHFISFDIGATSGRTILASIEDNKITLKELTRFPNKILRIGEKFYWNIYDLYNSLKEGLMAASKENIKIESVGIDTWGVDFVYLGEDDSILNLPRSYRDPYTEGIPEKLFKIIPKKKLYELTGTQTMNFNSLFQLYAAKQENSSALNAAKTILFTPDALSFLLTGKKVCEYTIASTSQLLNPYERKINSGLLEIIGLDPALFPPMVYPGTIIGNLSKNILNECGLSKDIPVIAVAGHDTASAVAAVPAENENFAYLSSGTWSLMGIEVKEPIINAESFRMDITNEGGVDGTIRFLKNITGMWLLEQCRKEWENEGICYSYLEIVDLAESAEAFRSLIDPDDASFANPESMLEAIRAYCASTGQPAPSDHAQYIRCIFESLALKYKQVFESFQQIAPFKIEKLHVIGGGSNNKLLNQFTANTTGALVEAGPSEATAIGNAMLQAKGLNVVSSLSQMRKMIRESYPPEIYYPQDTDEWQEPYKRFLQITKLNK